VSKIRLTPNASGTGTVTLTVPSTSTDRTITLPDTTGTLLDTSGQGADQWRLTTTITATSGTTTYELSSNLERADEDGAGYVGTGMTESSGIFTFPATGMWLIQFTCAGNIKINDNVGCHLRTTTDNSTYDTAAFCDVSGDNSDLGTSTATTFFIFDVTDVSTHKVRFRTESMSTGSQVLGDTTRTRTGMFFQRLGDT
jgi:hypothetical protein